MKPDPRYPEIYHIGFVVPDMADTQEMNRAFLGELDIYRRLDLEVADAHYCGAQVSYAADVAFYDSGNLRVELIQPVGDGPSPYHEHLAAHGGTASVHHIAYLVDSIDDHLQRATERGSRPRLILEAPLPGGNGRYAYYEGLLAGVITELIERIAQ